MQYETAVIQLPLVRETPSTVLVNTPEVVREHCADLAELAQESFHVLLLDTNNRLLDRVMVSLGVLDASLIHPREVFRPAILGAAAAIVAVHNHPSGDPEPSAEDIRLSRQLVEAGRIIDIRVMDSVVIGRDENREASVYSMRENGLIDFR